MGGGFSRGSPGGGRDPGVPAVTSPVRKIICEDNTITIMTFKGIISHDDMRTSSSQLLNSKRSGIELPAFFSYLDFAGSSSFLIVSPSYVDIFHRICTYADVCVLNLPDALICSSKRRRSL